MKLTLALCLFASVAVGQDSLYYNGRWHHVGEDWPIYTGKVDSRGDSTRPVTVHDLNEYSKECYADSTWISIRAYTILERKLEHYSIVRRSEDGIIYLRAKPTFPGFIQYMKGKK
jgi:hypothetical protein